MSQSCCKIPSSDDVRAIRDSIEKNNTKNPEPATVEWVVEFNPPADKVEVTIDEINGVDRITAEYDKLGMLHITKVYTEDKDINGIFHPKGEIHETLSFPEQNYRVSQDTNPDGSIKAGTAHITDQRSGKVVWRE